MKNILVLGAGGFIGNHLVCALREKGNKVIGVDLKDPEFSDSCANKFWVADLRLKSACAMVFEAAKERYGSIDEVYQLAADMGGAGFVFTGDNDAEIMHNSALINLNVVELCKIHNVGKVFYSSSACMYPSHNQEDPNNPLCTEESAYPANPDSEYGWEKLFSERLYLAYARNHGLNVRIARFHNIYGPFGTFQGGREKAPAAICRKVITAKDGDEIEIWGNGNQTRSFLYIDECINGILRLMDSDFTGPVNIGSDEMITINGLAQMVINISGKKLSIKNIDGPVGVAGRTSDNSLIRKELGWAPSFSLEIGLRRTYEWMAGELG